MKASEFTLLTANGAISQVTVWRDSAEDAEKGWVIFAYGDGKELNISNNALVTARGETRRFASLDTAHAWIRSNGWAGLYGVDGE
jgi:hypothetical protein